MSYANRMNAIFLDDTDGILTFDNLSNLTSKSTDYNRKMINKGLEKSLSNNVSLDENTGNIVLIGGNKEANIVIEQVICQSCGAKVEIRKGYSGRCPYCNSIVN